jgi:hypothetical protein
MTLSHVEEARSARSGVARESASAMQVFRLAPLASVLGITNNHF